MATHVGSSYRCAKLQTFQCQTYALIFFGKLSSGSLDSTFYMPAGIMLIARSDALVVALGLCFVKEDEI